MISTLLNLPVWNYIIALVIGLMLLWKFLTSRKTVLPSAGKAVLISGCDSGIGNHLARRLHAEGFVVFAGCLLPEGEGAKALKRLSSPQLLVLPLDITSDFSVSEAIQFVRDNSPEAGLWALINNAGVCVYGEFEWQTWNQCTTQVEINLMGTIRLTKLCLPLIRRSSGRIVNITSINGSCAFPGLSTYSATKFGLEGFSDSLRLEMTKFNVRVVVIQPGDLARLTNIMQDHRIHADRMWSQMNTEQKNLYGNYFYKYHQFICENYGMTSPPNFESSSLFTDVLEALSILKPQPRYVSAPWQFRYFYRILQILPTRWSDKLVEFLFARVFKFKL
ncbi:D-beta-hydroxybutyrate dehydrogenase, mitochondrial-like [Limulus polyphemus]|uniref:D-beta-hydroxybutyrate dehydrogenase, mitochondrial-like n=1 Tax=Limulus polyphemus TaxID=6850 RepID=A0ABM1BZU3_LIMPO|nr:D-beta-hydroxybutyrate dehydrogenase, mitochondrial-like [Limulus polyphemus]